MFKIDQWVKLGFLKLMMLKSLENAIEFSPKKVPLKQPFSLAVSILGLENSAGHPPTWLGR